VIREADREDALTEESIRLWSGTLASLWSK